MVSVVFQRLTTYRKSGRLLILRVMAIYQQLTSPALIGKVQIPRRKSSFFQRSQHWGLECCAMKLLLIILVASSQISLGQDRETTALAGCYELQAEGQHTYISNYGEFPRRLQLTLERSKTRGALVAKRLDSGVLASRNWRVVRNNSIEISPSEGWITNGWFIELSRSGSEFRGAAHYWTDTGDGPRIGVVGHKVACREQ